MCIIELKESHAYKGKLFENKNNNNQTSEIMKLESQIY